MGHAAHFLSRLERLEYRETELALSLYRDVDLLRAVLCQAKVPETRERVAIALRHEEGGPHLVVTRDGGFVTCLGAGMSVGDLQVIPRSQLDAISKRVENLRAQLEVADALVGPGKRTQALFDRMAHAGHTLSLEEFFGISGFATLYSEHFGLAMAEVAISVAGQIPGLVKLVDGGHRSPRVRQELLKLWNKLWSVAHVTALCCEHARSLDESAVESCGSHYCGMSFALMRIDFQPIALRAVMFLSSIGKGILPAYKEILRETQLDWAQLEAICVMLAMGGRFEPLRAEIGKVLAKLPPLTNGCGMTAFDADPEKLSELLLKILEEPRLALDHHIDRGRKLWEEWTRSLPPDSPLRHPDPESSEARMASAFAGSFAPLNVMSEGLGFVVSAGATSKLTPQLLYLPAKDLAQFKDVWTEEWAIEQTAQYLERYRKTLLNTEPERVERKAAPNDRCPCGSGKKFKRCCMGKAA